VLQAAARGVSDWTSQKKQNFTVRILYGRGRQTPLIRFKINNNTNNTAQGMGKLMFS